MQMEAVLAEGISPSEIILHLTFSSLLHTLAFTKYLLPQEEKETLQFCSQKILQLSMTSWVLEDIEAGHMEAMLMLSTAVQCLAACLPQNKSESIMQAPYFLSS